MTRRAPRDGPLGVQAFEVTQQQHPEVPARRQARAAHAVGIELGALGLDEGVEVGVVKDAIQPLVERVPRASPQVPVVATHIVDCRACLRRFPMAIRDSVVRGIDRVDPYNEGLSPRAARLGSR